EQELAQRQLKAKQRFAKVFSLAKTTINKAIELDLDEKLISILENFRETEIKQMLTINNTTYIQFDESEKENFVVVDEESNSEYRKSNESKINVNDIHKRPFLAAKNPVVKC
ncbi:6380_t:CDS:1, partial [Funneliformis geosporum]